MLATLARGTWMLALGALVVPHAAIAQEAASPTTYAIVDCMKSTSSDWESVETEIWQPVHEEMVRRGLKMNWTLYSVAYGDRSECDYYTVNFFVGLEQLNGTTSMEELFAAVHPDVSFDDVWEKTYAARTAVRTERWAMVDGLPFADHEYLIVSLMHADNGAEYEAMEREMWHPVAQALVDAGHMVGWGVWALQSPGGTNMAYNYSAVNAVDAIAPIPWNETLAAVHPDRDVEELGSYTDAMRTMVRGETWSRVATTTMP